MISSSNFVAIARVVFLARKDSETTNPFSSLLDLHFNFVFTAGFFKKGEYKEGKFHWHMPNKFVVLILTSNNKFSVTNWCVSFL